MEKQTLEEMQTWYNIIETTGESVQSCGEDLSQLVSRSMPLENFIEPGFESVLLSEQESA